MQNVGRVGAMLTPNGCFYICASFGENRSRNATVRVHIDGQTDTQMQTSFITCPIRYAIAMGQKTMLPSFIYVKQEHNSKY